ncbi:MAG TPA: hypothetical protein VF974_08305 [Patescibacteria group bacterium]
MNLKLITAVYQAYNKAGPGQEWHPLLGFDGSITTFCNLAVNLVCNAIGYTKFNAGGVDQPVTANSMFTLMNRETGDWLSIPGDVAQAHANSGALVLAAQMVAGAHGHVCVIIPSEMMDSAHYQKKVPVVMNVGKDVFIGKPVSYAFRAEPTYFVLKETVPDGRIPNGS